MESYRSTSSLVFSPSQNIGRAIDVAEPMVLTRDLRTLHDWQIAHGLLPEQAPGNLDEVYLSLLSNIGV